MDTITVVHYTASRDLRDNLDAKPAAICSVVGFGAGLWVYPVGAEHVWENRYETVWEIPAECVREYQRFEPGEAGNAALVIELFIAAEHFDRLERVG